MHKQSFKMNNVDFDEDSDSSDEDYVPGAGAASGDIPSEVDSDGDAEDPLSDAEETGDTKRTKRRKTSKKKSAKNGDTSETNDKTTTEETANKTTEEVQEEKKKHADDLWASFKRDTGFKKKSTVTDSNSKNTSTNTSISTTTTKPQEVSKPKQPDTVKITQIFEFAGEQVKVEKEVKADSAEARLSLPNSTASASTPPQLGPKRKSAGLGGIGSVLSQINKKQKLSVLEKTKLDWNQYKQKEQIEDELESYKKGKDGYLEKQDFLQRADLRQFEIEKEVRAVERSKRMNNAP